MDSNKLSLNTIESEVIGIKDAINYPFGKSPGRENARLLFDFSSRVAAFDA
jgi:hypothetical protein